MKSVALPIFLALCGLSLAINDGYKHRFLSGFAKGLSCNKGYTGVPDRFLEAADRCSQMNVTTFACFVTCVYTEIEFITPNDERSQLDMGMGEYATMEIFDMESKGGRQSAFRFARQQVICARDYVIEPKHKFSTKYDDAAACAASEDFFQCSWTNFFCGLESKDVNFRD